MIEEIKRAIYSGNRFLITSHIRLDGDALGSELALYLMLKGLGKQAVVCNQDETPEQYRFLPGAETIVHRLEHTDSFDVGFVLDCANLERVGNLAADIASIGTLISIDHHISNNGFARIHMLDPEASSTAEILYRLIMAMKLELTPDICTNLYAAILTDTGGFRYYNTSSETLRSAGDLIEGGANPQWISENIYESEPPEKLKLLAAAMGTMEIDLEGKVAYMVVTSDHLRQTGATLDHTDGFVDIPRTVRGVDIALLFTQIEENRFKISLRSKGSVNVEKIASKFGGGGHTNAAACRIQGDLETVKLRMLNAINPS